MTPIPESYGPIFSELLEPDRVMPLGPGQPHRKIQSKLEALEPETSFADKTLRDPMMARCAIAGVWLLHDYLEESHKISQEIHTPTGSYWHGILHRREPDYENAKYWFGLVGKHPIFQPLAREAALLAAGGTSCPEAAALASAKEWSPVGFVDLCRKAAAEGGALEDLCLKIQTREWWLIFDHCYHRALS